MRVGRLGHQVFALGYGAAGAVTALLLAVFRPQTDPVLIIMAGVQVVMAGGLIHEVVTRRRQHTKLVERLTRMRRAYEDLVDLILKTRVTAAAPVAKATATPDIAKATATPDIAKATATPDIAKATATPDIAKATATPDIAKATATPGIALGEAGGTPPAPAPLEPTERDRRPPARLPARATPTPAVPAPAAAPEDSTLAAEVREAITERRVEAFLQPMVTLPGRKSIGFEVLARLRASDGAVITPDRFLSVAEHEGLLPSLDLLILNRAGRLIRETDRHRHAISFFCNVARPTLADQTFMAEYLGGDRAGLRDKLVFELSQRDFGVDPASALNVAAELARAGYRLSMDRVERLTLDPAALAARGVRYLKLSYALISATEQRGELDDLRRRLNAHAIELIVEKVETERQAQEIELLGFGSAQGFLFGEPRPGKRMAP